jgi:hypothetical protein
MTATSDRYRTVLDRLDMTQTGARDVSTPTERNLDGASGTRAAPDPATAASLRHFTRP